MKALVSLLAAGLLTGCAALVTQSPNHGLSPVNAVSDGPDKHLILRGADVVGYFTDHKRLEGSPEIKSEYKGVTFRFATAEHKAMFDRAPEKYIPQFGGYCTNGIAYGIPLGTDVPDWEIIDGKLYMFGGHGSHDAFNLHPAQNMAFAQKYWSEEVNGSNAFAQLAKRLVFNRVPHYKTGRQLSEEVAKAKGG